MNTPIVVVRSTSEKRVRLAEAVEQLGRAIASGACTPVSAELDALARVCADQQLYVEAWRIRRWMTP